MATMIGAFLRMARERANISQAELATKLGLRSAQSISNIERGIAPLPLKMVKRMADILKVDKRAFVEALILDCKWKLERETGVKI
jgi:transcriptional regulator with XRE-family HTH domain